MSTTTQFPIMETETAILRRRTATGDRTLADLAALASSAASLDEVFAATAALSRRQMVDAVVAAAQALAIAPAESVESPRRRVRRQWVTQLAPRAPLGPRLYPDEEAWTDEALRAAHAAVARACATDQRHLEGERIYQRLRKRQQVQARRSVERTSA